MQVVVTVGGVQEQDAGLCVVVGGLHDLVPQITRPHCPISPLAVTALMRAGGELVITRARLVHQIDFGVVADRLHEGVAHADGEVEVLERAGVLGVDEGFDVRMVDAQHTHLRAAPRARGFHRLARGVEHPHERQRAAGAAVRRAHMRPRRTDARKVVAHAAAATHGFRRLRQRLVDAGLAVLVGGHRIAHRLDETVDECGLDVGPRGGHDASRRNEASLKRLTELHLAIGRIGLFDRQCAGHPGLDVFDGVLPALGVFFRQHVEADVLWLHEHYFSCFSGNRQNRVYTSSSVSAVSTSVKPSTVCV
ncbi:hypothetical protein GALL_496440 [mine drainage metagenome]|uniref:Uncharacterized protein n=1 Tax=mine drainage metagenome TaxID=410659 RepID=A0A1J5PDC0_9ZZZZ